MVSHVLLARLDLAQTCLKVTKNLLFSAKMACFQSFLMKLANFSKLLDKFVQGLDVLKVHERPFKKLQSVWRSTKKVSMLYEQYFLYFFKFENKAITYVLSDRASTFDDHCSSFFKGVFENNVVLCQGVLKFNV